jgi:hypothetical protein
VRSKSEQFIADWFYRHSIKYEYEPLLNVKDFDFHPDFYIPAANLYIEHISSKSFSTKNKEEQFEKGHLLLVKTYESMTVDSALFNHTLDKVLKNRLPANYHKTVSLSYKEEFNGYHENARDFVTQMMHIIDMIKVENIDPQSVLQNARQDQHERVRHFMNWLSPLLKVTSLIALINRISTLTTLSREVLPCFKTTKTLPINTRASTSTFSR